MAFGLWDVKGSFIIPGTRTKGSFGPVRIGDFSRQAAAKHLAKMLNQKFARDLRGDHKFGDHFPLMNLQWEEVRPKAPKVEAAAAE